MCRFTSWQERRGEEWKVSSGHRGKDAQRRRPTMAYVFHGRYPGRQLALWHISTGCGEVLFLVVRLLRLLLKRAGGRAGIGFG